MLASVVELLDLAAIPHMLVGSVASSFHGEPRTTQDIDLIVEASPSQLVLLVESIDRARYYIDVDVEVGAEDVAHRTSFNIIDTLTGEKVDLLLRRDRAFSRAEFNRRLPSTVLGTPVFVATAEDVILAKLEWAGMPPSERQLRDVASILRVRSGGLDNEYLDRWAAELGLQVLLAEVRAAAGTEVD